MRVRETIRYGREHITRETYVTPRDDLVTAVTALLCTSPYMYGPTTPERTEQYATDLYHNNKFQHGWSDFEVIG